MWPQTALSLSENINRVSFLFPATNFDDISGILIILEKSSPISPPFPPLQKVFEVDKHIQKLLGGKHSDTFTAIRLYRKAEEKLGFDGKKGTKNFSKAFSFFLKHTFYEEITWYESRRIRARDLALRVLPLYSSSLQFNQSAYRCGKVTEKRKKCEVKIWLIFWNSM